VDRPILPARWRACDRPRTALRGDAPRCCACTFGDRLSPAGHARAVDLWGDASEGRGHRLPRPSKLISAFSALICLVSSLHFARKSTGPDVPRRRQRRSDRKDIDPAF
jgi:hypothetical protein